MGPTLQALNAPRPPAFLDPLFSLEDCYYYAVPNFFDINHPCNRWMLGRIKANDADALRRKIEVTPSLFHKYFQMVDNPSLFIGGGKAGGPMYHNKCVLYLTPLGISLYMKSKEVTELLLTYRDSYGEQLTEANEVQFASHLQDPAEGDFHAFPPFLIAARREFFAACELLQLARWDPNTTLALPIRRRYERRAFYYRDWLDLALHLLATKTFYPIQMLVSAVISVPTYRYSMLPLSQFRPGPKDPRLTPVGLVDVNDLPRDVRLTGTTNLLELAEKYDRYLQLQQTAHAIKELKREAENNGYNPELLEQVAYGLIDETDVAGNRNNSARRARRSRNGQQQSPWYCSEPLRILLFSLEKDIRCKSLQQCIDAINMYIKHGFFLNSSQLPWADARARDQRNIVNCLLNMARREQNCIDAIRGKCRSGKRRFPHVEAHKVLENRRQQHAGNIDRLIGSLAQALLHSKEIVAFLHLDRFPLFSSQAVDFQVIPKVKFLLPAIRLGVICEFNRTRNAWRHLSNDMMRVVAKDTALTLHLKVGQPPSKKEITDYTKMKGKAELEKRLRKQRAMQKA